MRKKGHKKINPSDSSYDRFYVVNYQEFGKTWGALASESQFDGDDDDDGALNGFNLRDSPGAGGVGGGVGGHGEDGGSGDAEWEEWRGDPDRVSCLFCPASYPELEDLLIHMTSIHDFDYQVRR